MINYIWGFFLVFGIIYAGFCGNIEFVTESAIKAAQDAVILSLNLLGMMCLWLGLMNIAKQAGMIRFLAKNLKPLLRLIFPSIPANHPALGAIVMTISANMLGLGNAATPLGIKAMQQLQTLNKEKKKATPAMCTFLVLCTTGTTLVPMTIIALRSAMGAATPTDIVGCVLMVSCIATIAGLGMDFLCRKILRLR